MGEAGRRDRGPVPSGEHGHTSCTMRTFHIGGTAQVSEQSFIEAMNDAARWSSMTAPR